MKHYVYKFFYKFFIFQFLICTLLISLPAEARESLISSSSQFGSQTGDGKVTINLNRHITLGDSEDIVFEITRSASASDTEPLAILLESDLGDGNFREEAYLYFLYRGKSTKEYTERIHIDRTFSRLRLSIVSRYGGAGATGSYTFGTSNLQIYQLHKGEPYTSSQLDRLHLTSDYRYEFSTSEFENTPGILHEANRQYSSDAAKWCDWTKWKDGQWTGDSEILDENKFSMPDFRMLSSDTNTGDMTYSRLLAPGEKRQPTHTTEHVLYAVPGDAISLYPYYEMERYAHSNYLVTYSHWYDWKTGGHLTATNSRGEKNRILDFAIDPSGILYNEKYGYFGGPGLGGRRYTNHFYIYTPADYIAFANRVNTSRSPYTAEIMADLDFTGYDNVSPIGFNSYYAFSGKIDGHNHRISNLKITLTNDNGCGLIGRANGCEIRNLIIDESCTFTAPNKIGAVIGIAVSPGGLDNNGNPKQPIIISNIDTRATIVSTSTSPWGVGGLVGYNNGDSGKMDSNITITDCHVGGKISSPNGNNKRNSVIGLIGKFAVATAPEIRFANIYIDAELSNFNSSRYAFEFEFDTDANFNAAGMNKWTCMSNHFVRTNCWRAAEAGRPANDDFDFKRYLDKPTDSDDFLAKMGSGFELRDGKLMPVYQPGMKFEPRPIALPDRNSPHDYPRADFGTTATFFYPRDPYTDHGVSHSLPEEYVIAADFSQSFNPTTNIVGSIGNDKIVEPIIQYRHIFRIKDGVAFAEEFSGSADNNLDYVTRHRVQVGARKGEKFQIRLDSPAPATKGTPSRFYYKISNTDYRRVCTMAIHVYDADSGREITNELPEASRFKFIEQFPGMGGREIDGVTYNVCGGGGSYYRMLACDNPDPRYPRVTVLVTGNDAFDRPISVYGSAGTPLVVMQFNIEFLDSHAASFITEQELYTRPENERFRPEYIETQPNITIEERVTFDEYRVLEKLTSPTAVGNSDYLMSGGEDKFWVKWPLNWEDSNYAFGYDKATSSDHNQHYDYNEYVIANHSDVTPYHAAASLFPVSEYDMGRQSGGGLYDRLYYDTERKSRIDPSIQPQKGYFYYVNAATDPGVMSRLETHQLCDGSTMHVSAWVSEFSHATLYQTPEQLAENGIIPGETANLAFNFVAVLGKQAGTREGERVKLHTFVTGYVPYDELHYGHWMHVYYSFTPRLSDSHLLGQIDHFELELDNNCRNSEGADYAIDDIILYVENPSVEATQLEGLCDDEKKDIRVKIETKFDVFMEALELPAGTPDNHTPVQIFYTFVDKDAFDAVNDRDVAGSGALAYYGDGTEEHPGAVLTYDYNGDGKETTYGLLWLDSCFNLNEDYHKSDPCGEKALKYIDDEGIRRIAFNTMPGENGLDIDKEYYIAVKAVEGDEPYTPTWDDFDLNSSCTMRCVFKVKPSSTKKVDGRLVPPDEDIICCENMHPVVQIVLNGYNLSTGEIEVAKRNAIVDWYTGTLEEYYEERSPEGATLPEALAKLRDTNDHADSVEGLESNELGLTQDMIDFIASLTNPQDGSRPKLILFRNSYIFPSAVAIGDEAYMSVTAIPIETIVEGYRICSEPILAKVKVVGRSPAMTHGFSKGIEYPEEMEDVPLRASWQQLRDVTLNKDELIGDHGVRLRVPIRKMEMSGVTDTRDMRIRTMPSGAADTEISLVWTDDPEYTNLGSPDAEGKEMELLPVGEITNIVANLDTESSNMFECLFYNDFQMKEGFTYSFRYPFEESSDEADKNCPGQDVFTIKVVPRYLRFTAERGHNFNNDSNWRRVNSEEIMADLDKNKSERDPYFTNLDNKREKGFAPLDFTYAIIPGDVEAPHLFDIEKSTVPFVAGAKSGEAEWSMSGSKRIEGDFSRYAYQFTPGAATPYIEYDMAAYYTDIEGESGVYCRPWYANTCREIHFMPGSEMIGQNSLVYQKAWVDIELSPLKWHCISSPLQETFAGDLYLPTIRARQESEYFCDIKFSEDINNRFAPAVYQRGWNTNLANVYEYEKSESRNVAIQAGWSNVYNDVLEQYGGGTGFSIKTDPTDATMRSADLPVLFRLPKADNKYIYYDKPTGGTGHPTEFARTDKSGTLNADSGTLTVESAEGCRYFLIGNPLMSHLDMRTFLLANADKITPKYWIAGNGEQKSAIMEADGQWSGDAPERVAPMKSFFVEALDGACRFAPADAANPHGRMVLELEYGPEMATIYPEESEAKEHTRADAENRSIRIVTSVEGNDVASAEIMIRRDAQPGFNTMRDVALIDNRDALELEALPYAVAGGHATSICTRSEIEGTEIGVLMGRFTKDAELRIEGIDMSDNLLLHNLDTDSYTPITEGMIIKTGKKEGTRYRICSGKNNVEKTGIRMWLGAGTLHIAASGSDTPFAVTVADTMGRVVCLQSGVGETEIELEPGVYVVEAAETESRLQKKIIVR